MKQYKVLNNKILLDIQKFATHLQSWGTYWILGGSGSPNYHDMDGEIRVYLESQNSSANTSYIRIDHYARLSSYDGGQGLACAHDVTSSYRCNYGTYQSKSSSHISGSGSGGISYHFLGSTYHTVSHNSDGTCSLYVNGSISTSKISTPYDGDHSWRSDGSGIRTSSFTVGLPTIPRYATITAFNTSNITMTSFSYSVSANASIDYVQHSLNGGTWTDGGNQTITGLTPGVQYSLKCRVRRTDSGLWTESGTIYVTTTDLARISNSSVDFDIDNGIVINFTNPTGKAVDLYIETPNGTTPETYTTRITRTGITSPYTLTLTTEEKNTLFDLSPTSNSLSLRFKLRTDSNNSFVSYESGNGIISNANPLFTNFEYEDINTTTLDLTGNNQSVIKGYSNVKAIITTGNKAIAQKGATMSKYRFVCGEKQIDVNYSDSATVELLLNAIDNNVFLVYAIDSRGNSTVKQISPSTYFAYTKPTLKPIVVTRNSQADTHTTLSFEGSFFVADFGNVDNDITATYRYKVSDASEWTTGTTPLTLIKTGNTYEFEGEIAGDEDNLGFNLSNSYIVEVFISDLLNSNEIKDDEILSSGKPNIAWHKDGNAFGMPFNETIGESIQYARPIYVKIDDDLVPLVEWDSDTLEKLYGKDVKIKKSQVVNLEEVVLYNNTTGTNGNITLSETSENFKYINVFFRSNTGDNNDVKLYNPNGKIITLNIIDDNGGDSNLWAKMARYSISGTSFNLTRAKWRKINGVDAGSDNVINIYRIVGYK